MPDTSSKWRREGNFARDATPIMIFHRLAAGTVHLLRIQGGGRGDNNNNPSRLSFSSHRHVPFLSITHSSVSSLKLSISSTNRDGFEKPSDEAPDPYDREYSISGERR